MILDYNKDIIIILDYNKDIIIIIDSVLAHWNDGQRIHSSLHSNTISWFQVNHSLF
jgi:hypothetical protein